MKQLYIAYLLFCIILEVSRAQCPYNANISTICAKEAACLDKLKASNPLVLQSWQGCPCSGNSTQSSWLGVECMDYGGCWHVSNLSLVGLKLEGTLPGCVFNGSLGGLKALNLRNNSISGTLPTEIDSNSYLRQMQAGINRISGWLPHGFLDNGILLSLRLQNNSISGSLPSQANNCSISHLELSGNRLSGRVPGWLFTKVNNSIALSRNNFSGELPFSDQSEAINTTTLSHILLIHNMLSGTLPPWIATGSVEKLLLENNSFSGYMPSFGGNLEMLDLSQNVLSGYIPESLCGSSLIKSLRFSKNRVSGTLPPCLLQNVSSLQGPYNKISGYFPSSSSLNVEQAARNLQQVTMNDNKISGTVPLWINRLSNLNYLKSDNNKLSGTLSQDICRPGLTRLLAFSGNYLSGYLPECPGVFLQYSLYNNRFSGYIPPGLSTVTSLLVVAINNNRISGTLPNLVSPILNTLSIFSNEISGTIPNDLLAKRYLERVGAHANALVGTFPEILGPRIGVISLANNSLSGELPQSICSACKRLYGMLLENNNVRGNLGGFRNCSQLEFLQVSNNKLTGTIGGWISQMPKLLKLFVDRNDISGTVPQGISQLANLHDVLLFDNKFEGTLPEMQSRLETLSVHNNLISGTLPTSYYKMKSLEILTIHSNLISGSVASIGSSKLRHVHMHNNKISCRVPGMGLHNASTKGTILMGNRMEAQNRDEVPQWVFSSTRDNELLYTSGDDFMVIMIIFGTTGFVFIVFLVAVVYIFDTKEVPLALNSLLQEIGEESGFNINTTNYFSLHRKIIFACSTISLVFVPSLMSVYATHSSFYDCLDQLVILSAAYFKDPDLEAVVVALLLLYTVVATVWVLAIQNALARVHQETKLLYKRRIEIISNRTKPLFTESTENKAMQPSFPRFSVGVQAVAVADVQVNARVSRSPGGKRKEEEEGVITMSVNPMHPQAAQAVDGGRRSGCDRKLHGNEEEEEEEEENGNPESPPSNAAHNGNGKALAASDKPGVGNKQGGADNDNNGSAKKVHCKHFLRKTAFWAFTVSLWMIPCFVLSIPTISYVAARSLPSNNTFGASVNSDWAMLGFATLSVIVNLLLAPRAARITARFVGAPTQSSRLLLILQAFQTIVPLIVMIILDQGCLQMYLKFWRTCEDKDSFLIQRRENLDLLKARVAAPDNIDLGSFYTTYLTTASVCSPSFRYGFCSRRAVDVLGTFYAYKWVCKVFAQSIGSLYFSLMVGPISHYFFQWSMHRTVDFDVFYADVVGSLVEIVSLGPFVPIIFLFGTLSLAMEYITQYLIFKIGIYSNVMKKKKKSSAKDDRKDDSSGAHSEDTAIENFVRLPKFQIHMGTMLFCVLAILFWFENGLQGRFALLYTIVVITLAGLVAAVSINAWIACCGCHRSMDDDKNGEEELDACDDNDEIEMDDVVYDRTDGLRELTPRPISEDSRRPINRVLI